MPEQHGHEEVRPQQPILFTRQILDPRDGRPILFIAWTKEHRSTLTEIEDFLVERYRGQSLCITPVLETGEGVGALVISERSLSGDEAQGIFNLYRQRGFREEEGPGKEEGT